MSIGEADRLTPPREQLVSLVDDLRRLDVETQVAAFADGPVLGALGAVADVRRIEPLARRSAAGLVEGAARRVSDPVATWVQGQRGRAVRTALGEPPDALLLVGARAMPILRLVRTVGVPVTVYVHPWDHGISSLPPRDRRDLVRGADRFLVADESVVDELVAAGVAPERIELAPEIDGLVPAPPIGHDEARRARALLGLPEDRPVVAVPPVRGWTDMPDLTLAVAWELERSAGPEPILLWYGTEAAAPESWPVAYDVAHMGLRRVRIEPRPLAWDEVLAVADVVVLPIGGVGEVPPGFARSAALAARPLACWEGDARAADVAGGGGFTVPRGDVRAMADRIRSVVATDGSRRRARTVAWRAATADLERLVPLGLPVP